MFTFLSLPPTFSFQVEGWAGVDRNLNGRDMCMHKLPDHDANRNDFSPPRCVLVFFRVSSKIKNSFGIIYKSSLLLALVHRGKLSSENISRSPKKMHDIKS